MSKKQKQNSHQQKRDEQRWQRAVAKKQGKAKDRSGRSALKSRIKSGDYEE